ncbi:hypothetical protein DOK76_03730 [Vagococcus sp. DIV0080]|uniref:Uncharacterized protein n=1 Tax=Candidatus Vagococcus giribetii TaxID=2230876 RepID=A0ABS3HTL3_9ENTE|nr:hypothetical protein [Vagococcus sp. DIV0080]MBO0476166.1 hypothetical protein [Vagococcus sp. DIV0080]
MTESIEQTSKELQQVRQADLLTRKHELSETQNKILQVTDYDTQEVFATEFAESNKAKRQQKDKSNSDDYLTTLVKSSAESNNERDLKSRNCTLWN